MQKAFHTRVFYIAYIVAIVEELLRHSVLSEHSFFRIFGYGSLALAIGSVLLKLFFDFYIGKIPFSVKAWCLVGTAYIGFLVFRGQSDAFLVMWPFVMASWDCDFKRLVKTAAITGMCTIFFVSVLGYAGVIDSTASIRIRDEAELSRNSLGFLNVNHAAFFFFFTHLSWVYWRSEKCSWYEIISLELLELLLFQLTDSRTSFYLSIPATGVLLLLKALPQLRQYHKLYTWLAFLTPLICMAVFLMIGQLNPNSSEMLRELNMLTTKRLMNNYDAMRKHGFSFFGTAVPWTNEPGKYDWVDNVYIYSLISYGIPFMLLFFSMIGSLCRNAARKKDTYMILCLVTVALFGISENYCFRIEANPFYLFFAYAFTQVPAKESGACMNAAEYKSMVKDRKYAV